MRGNAALFTMGFEKFAGVPSEWQDVLDTAEVKYSRDEFVPITLETVGERVLDLWRRLQIAGIVALAGGPPMNEVLDERIQSMVRMFQKVVGLPQTGMVDYDTWYLLNQFTYEVGAGIREPLTTISAPDESNTDRSPLITQRTGDTEGMESNLRDELMRQSEMVYGVDPSASFDMSSAIDPTLMSNEMYEYYQGAMADYEAGAEGMDPSIGRHLVIPQVNVVDPQEETDRAMGRGEPATARIPADLSRFLSEKTAWLVLLVALALVWVKGRSK